MTNFDKSRWKDREFSETYANSADSIILERGRLIEVLKSYYAHFFGKIDNCLVLDLGCGDGSVTHELMKENGNINAMLVDGSEDMLGKAKRLLHGKRVEFVEASFQELLTGKFDLPKFDFVFSSLAIHHLDTDEKSDLFDLIKDRLNGGGRFVNIDVVLPPSEALEEWYLAVWRDWMDEMETVDGDEFINRYKDNEDNKPDTLESQLAALRRLGYEDVDCFYKFGIFAIYGGANQL